MKFLHYYSTALMTFLTFACLSSILAGTAGETLILGFLMYVPVNYYLIASCKNIK